MKNKLAVAVPSRGRPFGSTFQILKAVKDFPVYVFVHTPEYELYKNYMPSNFTIIPHDCGNLGQIRNLIMEYFSEKDCPVLMFDDDIKKIYHPDGKYQAGINTVLNDIASHLGQGDIYAFYNFSETLLKDACYRELPKPVNYGSFGNSFIICPSAYKKGLKASNGSADSEDFTLSVEAILLNLKIVRIPYISVCDVGGDDSYYGKIWYAVSDVRLYEKYGAVFQLNLDKEDCICNNYFFPRMVKEETAYSPLSNAVIDWLISWHNNQDLPEPYKKFKEQLVKTKKAIEGKPLIDNFILNCISLRQMDFFPELKEKYPGAVEWYHKNKLENGSVFSEYKFDSWER